MPSTTGLANTLQEALYGLLGSGGGGSLGHRMRQDFQGFSSDSFQQLPTKLSGSRRLSSSSFLSTSSTFAEMSGANKGTAPLPMPTPKLSMKMLPTPAATANSSAEAASSFSEQNATSSNGDAMPNSEDAKLSNEDAASSGTDAPLDSEHEGPYWAQDSHIGSKTAEGPSLFWKNPSGEPAADYQRAARADAEALKPEIGPDQIAWQNLEGLPKVVVLKPSEAFFSKDIADSGDGFFKPTLGCKCGASDWRPVPAHPTIEFRKPWLASHPDFALRVRKLKVRLQSETSGSVQWDATYDIKRFPSEDGVPRLLETFPALPSSGSQLRMLTFCPGEGGPSHTYKFTVNALDAADNPIEYAQNLESQLMATPPEPEVLPHHLATQA
eukprot:TRINITY_DN114045_c0_g1_i1.p1 TRINITY_DN114045_c0_g1~~TRINITY_DN114045_c0_g1_i1.p1  ORF type:complete len:383 (+),score=93.86 TRINITY_DN114045_c0_g1_i1:36-1184(+)